MTVLDRVSQDLLNDRTESLRQSVKTARDALELVQRRLRDFPGDWPPDWGSAWDQRLHGIRADLEHMRRELG